MFNHDVEVDGDDDWAENGFVVRGYPTVYVKKNGRILKYEGRRDADDILDFYRSSSFQTE